MTIRQLAYGAKPVVATLPSTPVDGQEIYFQTAAMAADGVIWTLRYNAASASPYKWEFVGGSPLIASVTTAAQEQVSSTAFAAVTTPGPLLTLPLAGDYDIQLSMIAYCSAVTASGGSVYMSYDIGATPATDADTVTITVSVANFQMNRVTKTKRKLALPAAVLTAKYKVIAGVTGQLAGTANIGAGASRDMIATPVRVG